MKNTPLPQNMKLTHGYERVVGRDRDHGVIGAGFINGAANETKAPTHKFTFYGGLLILRGTGIYIDWDNNRHDLFPGCFAQRLPGKIHKTYDTSGEWLECYLVMGKGFFRQLENIGVVDSSRPVIYPGFDLSLAKEFEILSNHIRDSHESTLPLCIAEAQRLLIEIYRRDKIGKPHDPSRPLRIDEACEMLSRKIESRIDCREVAASLNLGYELFRKLFKAQTGFPPGEYRIRRRIDKAKELLLTGRLTIQEIAFQLGYQDQFTFSRQFKKICGISPKKYRSITGQA